MSGNPVSKFFEGKIDVIDQTMKERIGKILVKSHFYKNIQSRESIEETAIEILELFSDLIQTTREEYKQEILTELNPKSTRDRYKDKDLALMRIQQQLRDFNSNGLERF